MGTDKISSIRLKGDSAYFEKPGAERGLAVTTAERRSVSGDRGIRAVGENLVHKMSLPVGNDQIAVARIDRDLRQPRKA